MFISGAVLSSYLGRNCDGLYTDAIRLPRCSQPIETQCSMWRVLAAYSVCLDDPRVIDVLECQYVPHSQFSSVYLDVCIAKFAGLDQIFRSDVVDAWTLWFCGFHVLSFSNIAYW
jgi:hypothetical protein